MGPIRFRKLWGSRVTILVVVNVLLPAMIQEASADTTVQNIVDIFITFLRFYSARIFFFFPRREKTKKKNSIIS
uniref:Uncharacterized protein n=1 Tax=viral metagenome TaxID=1070528 RepID=A0A6C0K365_9ZZZZ